MCEYALFVPEIGVEGKPPAPVSVLSLSFGHRWVIIDRWRTIRDEDKTGIGQSSIGMKRKLAAAVAIVLLLGVGYAGYVWYRHVTREDPRAPPDPDAPEAPEWTPPPTPPEDEPRTPEQDPPDDGNGTPEQDLSDDNNGTPEQDPPEDEPGTSEQDPPEDNPWPSKFVPPGDWSPRSASLMPLDLTVEIPEVPPEIMGPSPPIEDDPGENR